VQSPTAGFDLCREKMDMQRESHKSYIEGNLASEDDSKIVQLKRSTPGLFFFSDFDFSGFRLSDSSILTFKFLDFLTFKFQERYKLVL
jgi:hypothetical protein